MKTTNREKLVKDNVHEYIYIDESYFAIIDTAAFQRLKNVKQTSYMSLFPSSTHDRFTHSLGTYNLGKQVITELWKNIDGKLELPFSNEIKDEITFTFGLACLLHDVGHSPFSHTGENFYKIKKINADMPNYNFFVRYIEENKLDKFCCLDGMLINELCEFYHAGDAGKTENRVIKGFLRDYKKVLKGDSAKPHEKVSALISLKELKTQIKTLAAKVERTDSSGEHGVAFNADLFVRCIIGAVYSTVNPDSEQKKFSFFNAVISLLNSNIIDVDKLDYILRDNYMTGYKSIGIDTERLIKSFTVFLEENKWYRLAYKKNALSVIENVILANDSGRRWVQNHPIILYDTYITQRCVSEAFQILQEFEKDGENLFEKFFSVDALTEKGIEWGNSERIFLASDLDVIALLKKAYVISKQRDMKDKAEIFHEYFDRGARRHPLWKSEMEFKVCFNKDLMNTDEQERLDLIHDAVINIDSCKNNITSVSECIIDEVLYRKVENGEMRYPSSGWQLIQNLKTYFDRKQQELDIVIISTTGFESKMKKLNRKDVYVEMPDYALDKWNHSRLYSYSDLVKIKEDSENKPIFYFYSKNKVNTKELVTFLLTEAVFED